MNNKLRTIELTDNFMKDIKSIFRKNGYKLKTKKQSALIEWNFTKGSEDIYICGWHGTGNYGDLKMIFDIFVGCDMERLPYFIMPGNTNDDYGAGLPSDNKNTLSNEELDIYENSLKETKKWIINNIK